MNYVDLHVHTEFTKGNGITRIPELVKRAKEYGMESLAIVDSGTIDGFSEFRSECNNVNIKPIFGCGFYMAVLGLSIKETQHLVLLAKNLTGYNNIKKLIEFSNNQGLQFKPRIDFGVVEMYSSGLICLTGGLGGVFDKPFIAGNKNMAKENLLHLKKIFKDDLYLELQDNGLELNLLIRDEIVKASREFNIKMVVTGGSFYLDNSDSVKCNSTRSSNGNKTLEGSGYYFKSPHDINLDFKEFKCAISNSFNIAQMIDNI